MAAFRSTSMLARSVLRSQAASPLARTAFTTQRMAAPALTQFQQHRSLHSTPRKHNAVKDMVEKLGLDKLDEKSPTELYHLSGQALAVGMPVSFLLAPSILCWPVDIALGVVIPYHMNRGLQNIAEDYVPREFQSLSKKLVFILSLLTSLGLLKINLCGEGLTESIKSLWREPKTDKK